METEQEAIEEMGRAWHQKLRKAGCMPLLFKVKQAGAAGDWTTVEALGRQKACRHRDQRAHCS